MPSLKPTFNKLSFFDGCDVNNVPNYLSLFTEDEWEILFAPDYKGSPFLQKWKKGLAERLFEKYQDKPNTGDNLDKIQKFNDVLFPPPKSEEKEDERPFSVQIEQYFKALSLWVSELTWKKTKEWVKSFDTGKVIINLQIWFTGFRLFLLRSNRMSILTGIASATEPPFSLYVYLIKIGGLSYLLSVLADIGIIIYETFIRKRSARERCLPLWKCLWERFKAVMLEEGRIYRMLNDTVWASVNATGIFLTGGLLIPVNAAINVAGFGFDVANEFVVGVYRYYKIAVPEGKIDGLLEAQKYHLENYHKPLSALPKGYQKLLKQDYEKLSFDHKKLQIIKDKLQEKRMEILFDRLRIVLSLTLVVVGMVLVFYPPTFIPGAAILGATLALIYGSMATGLGARLYRTGKEWIPKLYHAAKNKIGAYANALRKKDKNKHVLEMQELFEIEEPKMKSQSESEQRPEQRPEPPKNGDTLHDNENGKNDKNPGCDTANIHMNLKLAGENAMVSSDATTITVTSEDGKQSETRQPHEGTKIRQKSKGKESDLYTLNCDKKSPNSSSEVHQIPASITL